MVGVPGKFKGCNTCRSRRVKCDNRRPLCKKCVDSGRECAGYERKRVFIVGTTQDRGRCSSHPHRSLMHRRGRPEQRIANAGRLPMVQTSHEFGNCLLGISNAPSDNVQVITLHTNMLNSNSMNQSGLEPSAEPPFVHSLPDFTKLTSPIGLRVRTLSTSSTETTSEGSLSLNETLPTESSSSTMLPPSAANDVVRNSSILFLYEVYPVAQQTEEESKPVASSSKRGSRSRNVRTSKPSLTDIPRLIKETGPESFKSFPDHYSFSRLYRHREVFNSMINRKATFLSTPEWCSVPWETLPKESMDRLFDIKVQLPGIFERADRIERLPSSIYRRLEAKDLLNNCAHIDRLLNDWYLELHSEFNNPLFWFAAPDVGRGPYDNAEWKPRYNIGSLFSSRIHFYDTKAAFLHMYYWAALCLLYDTTQSIERICAEQIPFSSPATTISNNTSNRTQSFDSSMLQGLTSFPTNNIQAPVMPSAEHAQPSREITIQPDMKDQTLFGETPSEYMPTVSEPSYFETMPPDLYVTTAEPSYDYDLQDQYYLFPSTPSPPVPSSPLSFFNNSTQSFLAPQTSSATISTTSTPPLPFLSQSNSVTATPPGPSGSDASSTVPIPVSIPITTTPDPDNKSIMFSNTSLITLANNICQSIPYIIHNPNTNNNNNTNIDSLDSFGPDALAWPLWNALQVYRNQGPGYEIEIDWCERMTEVLRQEGWAFADRIGRMDWKDFGNGTGHGN